MKALPAVAAEVLRRGTLCYLAAPARGGPHVTPVVFVLHGRRLWATIARGTAKARAWRREPVAAGLVRLGDRSVAFRGAVTLYDALAPSTWAISVARSPQVARASARFTLKNARFFAGYARDARRVPLGWTPPGRIIVSVDLDAGAVIEDGAIRKTWGRWGRRATRSREAFRASRAGRGPHGQLPTDVRRLLEGSGEGVLGIEGSRGPVVLPCRWFRAEGAWYAALPRAVLSLAGAGPDARAAVVVDRPSPWRAARMLGVLLRGDAAVYVPGRLRTGREALAARLRRGGDLPSDPAVVRLRPRTAVWWRGWASGTVGRR